MSRFLGVRLSEDELAALDQWRERLGSPTRSDAVRALVRLAAERTPEGPRLPVTVHTEIEELVEDGYARDSSAALETLLALGLREFARLHTERVPGLRRAARDAAERRANRRRADREGRGLLDR